MRHASPRHQTIGEKILVHNKAPGPTGNCFKNLSRKPNHPLRSDYPQEARDVLFVDLVVCRPIREALARPDAAAQVS